MRWYLVLVVCVAGMVVFAACSGGDETTPGAEETVSAIDAREAAFGLLVDGRKGDWTHESGRAGPYGQVRVLQGPEHCDWDRFLLLSLPGAAGHVQFVRAESADDPESRWVAGFVDTDATVPDEAIDTGYSLNGARLFIAPDFSASWIVFESHTERWPRQDPPLVCS